MTKMGWEDDWRVTVPSMFVTEDDDEVQMVDTGRVDKNGDPIVIGLSPKQGFVGFIQPGLYERMQEAKERAESKRELIEIIQATIVGTLKALGLEVDESKLGEPATKPAKRTTKTKKKA